MAKDVTPGTWLAPLSRVERAVFTWLFGAACGAGLLWSQLPPQPKVIGHDCLYTGGDVWAMQEDDLPPCVLVEQNR